MAAPIAGLAAGGIAGAETAAVNAGINSTVTLEAVGGASIASAVGGIQNLISQLTSLASNPIVGMVTGMKYGPGAVQKMAVAMGGYAMQTGNEKLLNAMVRLGDYKGLSMFMGGAAGLLGVATNVYQTTEAMRQDTAKNFFSSRTPYDPYSQSMNKRLTKMTYGKEVAEEAEQVFTTIRDYQKSWSQDFTQDFAKDMSLIGKSLGLNISQYITSGFRDLGESANVTADHIERLSGSSRENDLQMSSLLDSVLQLQTGTRLVGGDFENAAKTMLAFRDALKVTDEGAITTYKDITQLASSVTSVMTAGQSGMKQRAVMGMITKEMWGQLPEAITAGLNADVARLSTKFPELLGRDGKPKAFNQLSNVQAALVTPYLSQNLQLGMAYYAQQSPRMGRDLLSRNRMEAITGFSPDIIDLLRMIQESGKVPNFSANMGQGKPNWMQGGIYRELNRRGGLAQFGSGIWNLPGISYSGLSQYQDLMSGPNGGGGRINAMQENMNTPNKYDISLSLRGGLEDLLQWTFGDGSPSVYVPTGGK